jgi:hypothetical protein
MLKNCRVVLGALACCLAASLASAQDYPSKPIRLKDFLLIAVVAKTPNMIVVHLFAAVHNVTAPNGYAMPDKTRALCGDDSR